MSDSRVAAANVVRVRYQFTGPLWDEPPICHCRMCQKAFGTLGAPLVSVPLSRFKWTRGGARHLPVFGAGGAGLLQQTAARRCSCRKMETPTSNSQSARWTTPTAVSAGRTGGRGKQSRRGSLPWPDLPPEDHQREQPDGCNRPLQHPPAPRPRHGPLAMSGHIATGGCQCGAVRYRITGPLFDAHICHCRMCQKAFGNFFAALVGVKKTDITWPQGEPAVFRSSSIVARILPGRAVRR